MKPVIIGACIVLVVIVVILLTRRSDSNRNFTSITNTQLKEFLNDKPQLLVVDVREPDEYSAGHIPGAILIPLRFLHNEHVRLSRDIEIVLVCLRGSRSSQAANTLLKLGFTKLYSLIGGMSQWPGPLEYGQHEVRKKQ